MSVTLPRLRWGMEQEKWDMKYEHRDGATLGTSKLCNERQEWEMFLLSRHKSLLVVVQQWTQLKITKLTQLNLHIFLLPIYRLLKENTTSTHSH